MAVFDQLREIHRHNVQTLLRSPLQEIAGSLGDLGTLLPLMIALTVNRSISLSSTLVFSGLANIVTGVTFGVPLPVQPMKAIASIAISQHFTQDETAASGLTVAIAVLILSASGLLRWLNRVVPVPVVKGIQVGAGLSLAISAGASFILPLDWTAPGYDNRVWAIGAFILLLIAALLPRVPYALVVTTIAIVIAAMVNTTDPNHDNYTWTLWRPSFSIPTNSTTWRTGAIEAAIPQLPLTTLNSVLAVTSLSASLFPTFPPPPSTTALGLSIAFANLVGCSFGAMPICHGSGGLAGQYRFGARSGASIILLGLAKLLVGLFVGDAIVPLLQHFPKSLLGIMVLAAGVELAKVGQSVGEGLDLWERAEEEREDGSVVFKTRQANERERGERWMVLLVTTAGCLAFKNDAAGFLAGLLWHWGLRLPVLVERVRRRSSLGYSLRRQDDAETQALLQTGRDSCN
ncbi:hypothetical protein MBLNU230_g4054t1 [Neophaeotheca triangularis]